MAIHGKLRQAVVLLLLVSVGIGSVTLLSQHRVYAASVRASRPLNSGLLSVNGNTASGTPSVASNNGTFYIGWTGTNQNHNLNIIQYNGYSAFYNQVTSNDTTLAGQGPSLTSFNGQLYMTWLSSHNDDVMYIGYFNGTPNTANERSIPNNELSPSRPSIVAWNGLLYLAWRGTDNRLNIESSPDGINFGGKVTLTDTSYAGPTLAVYNNQLWIAWQGTDNPSHVWFGEYNPSNPGFLLNHADVPNSLITTNPGLTAYNGSLYLVWSRNSGSLVGPLQSASYANGVLSPTVTYSSLGAPGIGQGPAAATFMNNLYFAWAQYNAPYPLYEDQMNP